MAPLSPGLGGAPSISMPVLACRASEVVDSASLAYLLAQSLAISLCALGGWEAGARIVSTARIMPMSLMSPTLASSSIRHSPPFFGSDAGSYRSMMSSKALRLTGLLMPGCLHTGTGGLQSPRWAPSTPSRRLNLGRIGSLPPSSPDLHGFYKWVMDALATLNEFVLKVVHCRQPTRLQAWSNWIREDLTSHPYQWLPPDFVPPAPCLVCKPQDFRNGSRILVHPSLIHAHFRKAWMPYFSREGHPVVSHKPFLICRGSPLPGGLLGFAHPYGRGAP